MINPELHKKPVALDRVLHRSLKLRTEVPNIEVAAELNSMFITATEFGEVCKEYPILFLRAGTDAQGQAQVAPVAVFGLARGENLYINRQAAPATWRARYVPAMVRAYPFTMARLGQDQYAVAIDESWSGWSQTEGQALFDEQGEATPYLAGLKTFIERVEDDVEMTRRIGLRLMSLKLLQDRRFDATLPDGSKFTVDGFLSVDEKRLGELPDAEVLELHRSGLLGLLHAHMLSLSNMATLMERRMNPAGVKPA